MLNFCRLLLKFEIRFIPFFIFNHQTPDAMFSSSLKGSPSVNDMFTLFLLPLEDYLQPLLLEMIAVSGMNSTLKLLIPQIGSSSIIET